MLCRSAAPPTTYVHIYIYVCMYVCVCGLLAVCVYMYVWPPGWSGIEGGTARRGSHGLEARALYLYSGDSLIISGYFTIIRVLHYENIVKKSVPGGVLVVC